MSGEPKPDRRQPRKYERAAKYATAIGGAALAGSAVGPLGTVGGGVGMAVGCALDYWLDDDEGNDPDQ